MKIKLLISAGLCAIAFTANAQTEKGDKILGGSVRFSIQTTENISKYKVTSLSVGPRIGFFLAKNLAIGTSLNYSYDKTDPIRNTYFDGSSYIISSTSGSQSNSYGATPFTRYYINITDKFKFYGQFDLTANFGTQKIIDAENQEKTKNHDFQLFAANLNPGLAFFVAKKLAIELTFPLIGYNYQNFDQPNSTAKKMTFSAFSFAASTSPFIGINFHL